jgi:hypothetical protein
MTLTISTLITAEWPEDARHQLIDGAAYTMAPALATAHQEILDELHYQARSALEGSTPVYRPFDVRLSKADEADEKIDMAVQPDLLVVCDPAQLDEQGCHCNGLSTARLRLRPARDPAQKTGVLGVAKV